MNEVVITSDVLVVDQISNSVSSPGCGAISLFIGTTRDNFKAKEVVSLEYECYTEMARNEMIKICSKMREMWKDIKHIAIHHRTGLVPTGEASVIIAVSSPHRESALKATDYCINTLKKTVPIWKKEMYSDGSNNWKANKECDWAKTLNEISKR